MLSLSQLKVADFTTYFKKKKKMTVDKADSIGRFCFIIYS